MLGMRGVGQKTPCPDAVRTGRLKTSRPTTNATLSRVGTVDPVGMACPPAKEPGLLPSPRLRTGRESFPSSSSSISKAVCRIRQQSYHLLAVRYCTEVDALAGKVAPVEQSHRHLQHLLYRFRCCSRTETPQGSQLACAPGDIATRIRPTTRRPSLFPTPIPALPSAPLTIRFPPLRRSTGLPRSAYVPLDGLGTTCSSVGSSSAIGEGGAPIPPHLPFGSRLSAPLPCWFSRRLLVVHICFPYHPTLAPDRLDAGSRNLSSRFGCHAVA